MINHERNLIEVRKAFPKANKNENQYKALKKKEIFKNRIILICY